jgi:hypothetical protein
METSKVSMRVISVKSIFQRGKPYTEVTYEAEMSWVERDSRWFHVSGLTVSYEGQPVHKIGDLHLNPIVETANLLGIELQSPDGPESTPKPGAFYPTHS